MNRGVQGPFEGMGDSVWVMKLKSGFRNIRAIRGIQMISELVLQAHLAKGRGVRHAETLTKLEL